MLLPVHYSLLSSTDIGAKPPGGCDRGWRRQRVGGVRAYVGGHGHGRRQLVAVAAAAPAGCRCGARRQRRVAARGGGGGGGGKKKAVCRTTPLALMMVVAGDIFGKACHHVAPSSEK